MGKVGARILHDEDGEIIAVLSQFESDSATERKIITSIGYVDVPFGFTDNKILKGYDVENNQLIYEEINIETEEQRRIRELEDALLLQADLENGGIL